MNDIQGYILDRWKSKMTGQIHTLVIYDPEGMYFEILERAAADNIEVIDTSISPLSARVRATRFWTEKLAADPEARLIIYRRRAIPRTKREWVTEPYAGFAQSAQLFPSGPVDHFKNMCEQFMPTKLQELNQLFESGNTSFNIVNSLLDGNSYPALEALTHGHSIMEITINLLALESCSDMNWIAEWRTLAAAHFPGLDTNVSTLEQIKSKLWTYLLYSEFVFDLPEALPDSLLSVPRAPEQIKDNIYILCDKLRSNHNMRDNYVRAANEVATALNLPILFAHANHLGERVTFQFENDIEFTRFINYIKEESLVQAAMMLDKNKADVWYQEDRKIAAFWNLAEQLLALIHCVNNGIQADGNLKELIEWYAQNGYIGDKAFRSFFTLKFTSDAPHEEELTELLLSRYRSFVGRCVGIYQNKVLEITNLPELANQVCKQMIYPALHDGKRVAVAFVDALRYEVGASLADSLKIKYGDQVACDARLSVIPPVTRFGMANHLDDIKIEVVNGALQPKINGKTIITVDDRINYLKERTGTELQHFRLNDFSKEHVNSTTRLLVLLSTAIDSACESASTGLQGITLIKAEIKQLVSAVDICRELGFDEIHFVADHGFMLQPKPVVSDKIDKPAGNNICLEESRCMAGNLNETACTLTFSPQDLGIDGDFMKIAFAKNFTVFRRGEKYYHEGLSLQENVVPIVSVKFKDEQPQETLSVQLKYKGNDTGVVHTLAALIDVLICTNTLFSEDVNFKLKIQDHVGHEIGAPQPSAFYDDATEIMHVPSGTTSFRQQIVIEDDFNDNEFVVLALDSNTNAQLAKLVLKYDSIW